MFNYVNWFWKKNNSLKLSLAADDFIDVNNYKDNLLYFCYNGNNGDAPTELTVEDINEISSEYIKINKLNKLIADKKDHLLLFTEDIDLINAIGISTFGPTKVIINKFSNKSSLEKKSSALNNDIKLSFLISNSIFKKVQEKNTELTEDLLLTIKSTITS